jgi:hypothetical protein
MQLKDSLSLSLSLSLCSILDFVQNSLPWKNASWNQRITVTLLPLASSTFQCGIIILVWKISMWGKNKMGCSKIFSIFLYNFIFLFRKKNCEKISTFLKIM